MLAAVGTTLGWPAAELWLTDEDTGRLEPGGRWCAPGSELERVLTFAPIKGTGITGRVWSSGEPLWVPDIADCVTLRGPVERRRAEACLRAGLHGAGRAGARRRHGARRARLLRRRLRTARGTARPAARGVAGRIGLYVALRRAEERAGLAELTVADHGIGTPAEERDRVFDRFYRASNVGHQGIAGKGLGLSLARTIVELHDGTIRLSGHPPHGTTVLLRLPIAKGRNA